MRALRDLEHLDEKSYTSLFKAERFLRRLEHQLRLIHGRSVTRVPESRDLLAEVAAGLGHRGEPARAVHALEKELRAHRAAVERVFDRVVPPEPA
jgi:glutamine synthetase adenylyltransferase